MPTLADQIELEEKMVSRGVLRYKHSVQTAQDKGRGADTQYAQKLLREFLRPVAEAIDSFKKAKRKAGVFNKYKDLLRKLDSETLSFIGLRALFQHFVQEQSTSTLCIAIGTMIEDEYRFSLFGESHPMYLQEIVKDFERRHSHDYRYMHRVLTIKANETDVKWNSWTLEEKLRVGAVVIDAIMKSTNLVGRKSIRKGIKSFSVLYPTPEALAWVKDHTEYNALMRPDRLPCIIQPDAWISNESGGYWTPQVRIKTKLIKARSKEHIKMFDGDISNITAAINIIQRVPWQVNMDILPVMKLFWEQSIPVGLPESAPYIIPACPLTADEKPKDLSEDRKELFDAWKNEARLIHTIEIERVSKCFAVIRALKLAEEFSNYDKFWFVYQCDFRGRIYCTVSGLTPQGADFSKALLKFADGKPLGKRGAYWFKVHGANCFGKDKVSYDDRVAWVAENSEYIRRTADDPMRNKDWWSNADKPWQFLAWCMEYKRYLKEGDAMVSFLPVGLDGSCNGLQNFSAMLRDEVGGAATNLVPQTVPADIYGEVAKVCTATLRTLDTPEAKLWLLLADSRGGVLPRQIAKKPVMTLPYGSTQQSARESIHSYLVQDIPGFFPKEMRWKLASYLTPILWESISKVVIAAKSAMGWLQSCASIISKNSKPVIWWTPIGFPVYQSRQKQKSQLIDTIICGRIQLQIYNDTDELDTHKQMLAISPNFVHSMDACHLMLTMHRAFAKGVRSFAVIHDDYGTHACDIDALHEAIREAFIELYATNNPLSEFKVCNELQKVGIVLPPLPEVGKLNIHEVIDSEYFFG